MAVASCSKGLSSIPIEEFAWDTVTRVFQLPPFCLEADAFKPAVQKAVDKLISVFGDLEVVMNDEQLREQLLQLPCTVMAALLGSSHLRVASENSAVAAVFAWVDAHDSPEQAVDKFGAPFFTGCCLAKLDVHKRPTSLFWPWSELRILKHPGDGVATVLKLPVSQGSDMTQELEKFLIDDKLTISFRFGKMA
eukprot:jgi/Chrzof1/8124/UNPLg00169.t1